MGRTWLSVGMGLVLAALSVAVFAGRWYALGGLHDYAPGASTWKITLAAEGELGADTRGVTLLLPYDFRQQHIFDERFQGSGVIAPRGRKDTRRREVVWRRAAMGGGTQAFRLRCTFRCDLSVSRPTAAMQRTTRELDAAPDPDIYLKPAPRIESDQPAVIDRARSLAPDGEPPAEQVRNLYGYVAGLNNEPALGGGTSALKCLRAEGGDSGGKSRLLVALCRGRGIPARLVTGLVLHGDQEQDPHYWAEAWVAGHWLPACPTFRHFGARDFPENYLILHFDEDELVRGKGATARYRFLVQRLAGSGAADEDAPPSAGRRFWRLLSLTALRPAEQHLVKFLLLLPPAALIVSLYRTLVGVPTFGTFSPALLGLAFLNLQALPWGLSIFVLTVIVGWGLRRLVERLHLLLVPRTSVLLTLIVFFLIAVVVIASHQGVAVTQYIALFPLVILTHLVERFWTVEAEDGTATAFKTLGWTVAVAVTISLALSPEAVSAWLLQHPETLGLVLAALILLGRYTGYRVMELYRFRDLAAEPASEPLAPAGERGRSEGAAAGGKR